MSDNGQARCERCGGSGMLWEGNFHVICGCREGDEMSETERLETVITAQAMIVDAIDLIERAIEGHPYEDNWDAYVVAHLKILASGDHGYLSRDTNLDDIIAKLGGHDDEEDW